MQINPHTEVEYVEINDDDISEAESVSIPDLESLTDDDISKLESEGVHQEHETPDIIAQHINPAPNNRASDLKLIICLCLFVLFVFILWHYLPTLLSYLVS